ncbi:MAG: YadA-like family protein [Sedimenticola sp.]
MIGDFAGSSIVGSDNIAIGTNANYNTNTFTGPTASNTIAIGTSAQALDTNAVAIGTEAYAGTATSTSYGTYSRAESNGTSIGYDARIFSSDSVTVGNSTRIFSPKSVSVGVYTYIDSGAEGAMALGYNAKAMSGATSAVAIGRDSIATEANTVSVGSTTQQRRITNVADGVNANDAVNVSQLNALNVDPHLTVNASNSLGLGHTSSVGTTTNSVALGEGSVASEDNTVSVGSATQQRRITNVAEAVNGTDAVNLDQLNSELGTQLGALDVDPHLTVNASDSLGLGHTSTVGTTTNSVALGEGSVASEDNTVSVGSTTQQRRVTNVADAVNDSDAVTLRQLNNLDTSDPNLVTNANSSVGVGQTSSVGTTTNSVALGEGSVASEDNTVSVGSDTQKRRITNLADGVADSDAATIGQLRALELSDSNLSGRVNSLSNRVDDLDERMDNVGAMAAAMSGAHAAPQAMGDTQLALGVGNYNGSNAVAAGLFHYLNNKTLLSAGVSKGGSETAVSLGATFAW